MIITWYLDCLWGCSWLGQESIAPLTQFVEWSVGYSNVLDEYMKQTHKMNKRILKDRPSTAFIINPPFVVGSSQSHICCIRTSWYTSLVYPYYITHEDTKFTRPGEIWQACEQHAPKELESSSGQLWERTSRRMEAYFWGTVWFPHKRVPLYT
jgi:hypothetical protein